MAGAARGRRYFTLTSLGLVRKLRIFAAIALFLSLAAAASAAIPSDDDGWNQLHQAFAAAYKDYNAARDGTVTMAGPSEVTRGSYGEWTFVYRAGSAGLEPGGAIRLVFRHLAGWGIPQSLDQGGANYTTASASDGVAVELAPMQRFQIWNRYFLPFFPWQHVTEVKVGKRLAPGQTITLTLGDKSFGSPGLRAPAVARDRAWFMAFVDTSASGHFQAIDKDFFVRILPGPAVRLVMVLPSQAASGTPVDVQLRAEDSDGNVAAGYTGDVQLEGSGGALPATYRFTPGDQGLHWFRGVRFNQPGVVRVVAREGSIRAESNPMLVSSRAGTHNVYWGDLHGHTIYSDGTGTPQQYFQFARNTAALDFTALTDHIEMLDPVREQMIADLTDAENRPGRFVTIHAYEWGGVTAEGGHHNVYMLRRGVPSFRSSNSQNAENPFLYYGPPERGASHVARLYEFLREQPGADKGEILVIPHDRGATATPQWQDPVVQTQIELASESGYHEQWAQTFFVPGMQLGFIGSSDDHYCRPGYGMDDRFDEPWNKTRQGSPLAAVIAPEKTREAIFSALYHRHTYVTTGARILLQVSADGHESGDSYSTATAPSFHVVVAGTAPLKTVEIKKLTPRTFEVTDPMPDRNEHAQTVFQQAIEPGQKDIEFNFHETAVPGTAVLYYVHVVQADGEQAASSPIMIRHN